MFSKLKIGTKLAAVLALLAIPLVYFAWQSSLQEYDRLVDLELSSSNVDEVRIITDFVYRLEMEWLATFAHTQDRATRSRQELTSRRTSLDATLGDMADQTQNLLNPTEIRIRLQRMRDFIDRNETSFDTLAVKSQFDQLADYLLHEIDRAAIQTMEPTTKNQIKSVYNLSYATKHLADLRFAVRRLILNESFNYKDFASLRSTKSLYDYHVSTFGYLADTERISRFQSVNSQPEVLQFFEIIVGTIEPSQYAKPDITESEWVTLSMYGLDRYFEFQQGYLTEISSRIDTMVTTTRSRFVLNVVIAAILLLVAVILAFINFRHLVSTLAMLTNASKLIAAGDTSAHIEVKSHDELGTLSKSFSQLIHNAEALAASAAAIGDGKYEVDVPVRSNDDVLGNALELMREKLQKMSAENERRNWLLGGNAKMHDTIRGDRDLDELSNLVVTFLCEYLSLPIGAIYVEEGAHFRLMGSYAWDFRKHNLSTVKPGDGLVGQSIVEKKPIVLTSVPDDYVSVRSALGTTQPSSILVYPVRFGDYVLAVIELGSLRVFNETEMEFMNMVGENLGIAYQSTFSRSQTKELLEETQRQAEELEAQQEELKQSNEELMEKTGLLERSEAELKAQQEELQQTNEELEEKANLLQDQKERLELAKIEIENKARELEVTSKYKSEFLANMSHELRTPLNSILILSQMMAENKSGHLGDKEVEFAKNIYTSGTDLLDLINEILDLAKVEAGRLELEVEQFGLSELTGNLVPLFEGISKNKSITFTTDVDDAQVGPISSDPKRIEQVLRNLLSNAFKFTGRDGAVSLRARKVRPPAHIRNRELASHNAILAIDVEDDGIGIPADKLGLIFEAFQQADGSTKRQYGGTGLGLSISRELAHALGGEIGVVSAEGKGSTFTLYLPLQYDPALSSSVDKTISLRSQPVAPSPAMPRVKQTQRASDKPVAIEGEENEDTNPLEDDRNTLKATDRLILILEDDLDFARILLELVRERKFKGVVATRGNVGLSYARHYRPEAILLDMKLPVMDGDEILKQLKSDPDLRHIPVQVISGFDKRTETLTLGAFDFLQKPASRGDLMMAFDRIESFVNKKLKKLLIIEDNTTQNQAIRELMGNGDLKCVSAFTGNEGLELLRSDDFDCVIIDLGLPDINGFDLLETIKKDKQLNRTPIIIYTGKDLSKEENQKLTRLANTVVLKTAESKERLLDETMLFLHRVESKLPPEKQKILRKLHRTDEVLQNKRILVVDDDIRNIYSLTNMLEEEGMVCYVAENGKEAIEKLKKHTDVNLVLMDVMMPEMDGYEATRQIRSNPKHSKLPIIALTAKAMKGDREKCLNAGMSDYISKPVNTEQLLSLMRVWLYS